MLGFHVTVLVPCLLCLLSSARGSHGDEDRLSRLEQAMVSQMILNSDTEAKVSDLCEWLSDIERSISDQWEQGLVETERTTPEHEEWLNETEKVIPDLEERLNETERVISALEERLAEAEQMIRYLQTEILQPSPRTEGEQSDSMGQTTQSTNFPTENPGNMSSNTGDCQAIYEIGYRSIGPYNMILDSGNSTEILCEMSITEQWTIIQQRVAGDTDFYRTYEEYEHGFGAVSGTTDFWIGLEAMNQLTSGGDYMLRVDLVDWEGESQYAEYSEFSVGGDNGGYRLHVAGHTGTAGDSLGTSFHNGRQFSTHDHDSDAWGGNCAEDRHGGWWFGACDACHLNGEYYRPPDHTPTNSGKGIIWDGWRGDGYSLKSSQMKIRRRP